MGNSVGVPYSFQQEPLNGVVVASDNNIRNSNVQNNDNTNSSDNNSINSNNVNNPNISNSSNSNNANGGRANNFIISLAPRRGVLDGDNLFGTIRNDLAAYFPFGRFAPPPPIHQATTIKSLVNLHKDSVVFVREEGDMYKVHFTFDALEPCFIKVYFNATEILDENKKPVLQGKVQIGPIYYPQGTGQTFVHPAHSLLDVGCATDCIDRDPQDPLHPLDSTTHHQQQYPLVIEIQCDNCDPTTNPTTPATTHTTPTAPTTAHTTTPPITHATSPSTHTTPPADIDLKDSANHKPDVPNIKCQTTYCTLLLCGDGSYALKAVQQKLRYRGLTYAVHDIFGLDHTGERESEGSRECVVCMSEPRDTTVLPCRHLCVCAPCADLMRMQTNKCPICRAPVTSLLSIHSLATLLTAS